MLKDKAAIVGIAETPFAKRLDGSERTLAADVIVRACADAGLDPSEIDGLSCYTMETSDETDIAKTVGTGDLTFFAQVNYGGGAGPGCVGLLAIVAVIAQAAIVQTFTATVSPAKAKKPVSLAVSEGTTLTADDPGYQVKGQPPPQNQQVIRLQKGGLYNSKYFARCKLAALQANGAQVEYHNLRSSYGHDAFLLEEAGAVKREVSLPVRIRAALLDPMARHAEHRETGPEPPVSQGRMFGPGKSGPLFD